MVVARQGSYSTVSTAVRPPSGKSSSSRSFLTRNSSVLLLGLVACAVLSLGWRPLHSLGEPPGQRGGRLRPRAQEQEVSGAAVAAAVAASAGVHGLVRKEGIADLRNWHPDYKSFRQERLQEWMVEREVMLGEGRVPPPLPIYTGCQVYVNHLYKVVYLRHAKTASSSLFCHFGGCQAANASDPVHKALSFELLQASTVGELAQLDRLWRDYFVVTFVRNPYQRAVSSYRMMARQLAADGAPAHALTWNHFCLDPTGFADTCMVDELCKKKGRNFVYIHIQPQYNCIITKGGGWAVDFVGRVEEIDTDLRLVLEELERRRPTDSPPVKALEGRLANVNGRGCKEFASAGHSVAREQYCEPLQYYDGDHAACFQQVRHHYYSDVHSLRFGPDEKADV